ncbi:hypothetical protein [Bradyrhizobium sp. CCBAU 51753]|uniref:hypothetical protein n=1 Tax=Bradyrhizobium sp. CCBAU 51753 TaxID=1325100 RepID=UPI00188C7295|nr:hypothetical protein [Bradyrhizobium sp. CCBAU 51753]
MAKKSRPKKRISREISTRKGVNMLKGQQWTLISPHSLEFTATLVETVNEGRVRLAIFRVPKGWQNSD